MKRCITTLLLSIIFLVIVGLYTNKINYSKPIIKNIKQTPKKIDFQSFFNVLRKPIEKGFFCSKEINHLLKTVHYFNQIKIFNQYYEVYHKAHR